MRKKTPAGNAPFPLPNTLRKLATPKVYSDLFPSLKQNKITFLELQEHPCNLPFWEKAGFPCPLFPGISFEYEAELSTLPEQIWASSAHPRGVWEPALLIINIPSELEHPCWLPYQEMQHFNIKQQQGGEKRGRRWEEKKPKKTLLKFLNFSAWRGSNPAWKYHFGQFWTGLSELSVSSDWWAEYSQIPHPPLVNDFF